MKLCNEKVNKNVNRKCNEEANDVRLESIVWSII